MGLFGRRKRGGAPTVHECHSVAAFAPEDVEDAERAAPETGLDGYAARRGLVFSGSAFTSAVCGVQPRFPQYVFNSCAGALAADRYGVVSHELLELSIRRDQRGGFDLSMGGDFYGVRLRNAPGGVKKLVPGVELLGLADHDDEPFGAQSAWAPTTTIALLVPEAAVLPMFAVRSADRLPSSGSPRLGEYDLEGFRLSSRSAELSDIERAAIFGGPAGTVLRGLDGPYLHLELTQGQLLVRRGGFVADDDGLDRLVAAAIEIASALARIAHPGPPATADLAAPLGPPPAPQGRLADSDRWDATLDSAASQLRLAREDPLALHRLLPRLPVPGLSRGVLRGELPGGVHGRLTFHQHRAGSFGLRPALLLPALPGTPDSPPGGVHVGPGDMVVGVADGVVAAWKPDLDQSQLSVRGTTERGLTAIRAAGLADV